MSELQLYDPMAGLLWFTPPSPDSGLSLSPSWQLLKYWATELQQVQGLSEHQVWHTCMHERSHFAHALRQLDWRVYYYRDAHGVDGINDAALHYNYGRRWGYIVAPYCEKFVFWRLSQL